MEMSTNVNARYLGSSLNVNVDIFFKGDTKNCIKSCMYSLIHCHEYILALSIFQWQQYIVKNNLLHDMLIKMRCILYIQSKGAISPLVNVDIRQGDVEMSTYVNYRGVGGQNRANNGQCSLRMTPRVIQQIQESNQGCWI